MNYCFLLAGGTGTRMGKTGIPKQFLALSEKPIVLHTLDRMINNTMIDKIIIICNPKYIDYLKDLLIEFDYNTEKIYITNGGDSRLNSVLNGIKFVEEKFGISQSDIFLAHDSVRPFVSDRIINENLKYAKKYNAATTVLDLIETIVETDGENICKAYPRTNFYLGQSPQTFNMSYFISNTKKIPKDVLNTFTDLSENILYNNGKVFPVLGEKNNIKITTPIDLIIANELLTKSNE